MDFSTFLKAAQTESFWQEHKNFCFAGNTYPLTWFNMLFGYLDQKNLLPAPYQRIFLDNIDKKNMHATLNQSILGMFSFFWFGDISEAAEAKSTKDLADFMLTYQGPHALCYFIDSTSKLLSKKNAKKELIVTLPSELNVAQFNELTRIFDINLDTRKTTFIKNIVSGSTSLDLETSCMLINYIELISSKYLDDYSPFLANVIGTSPSLSQLSEYFFAKNSNAFFSVWSKINNEYPDIFWLSFWAEQVWKAHHVIKYLNEKNFVQAKRMAFRLPYSFINRDWQKSNSKELAQAHEFLYHIDYALKTGSSFCAIDLFYVNYFTGKFAQRM
jgi:hypothetical protein